MCECGGKGWCEGDRLVTQTTRAGREHSVPPPPLYSIHRPPAASKHNPLYR